MNALLAAYIPSELWAIPFVVLVIVFAIATCPYRNPRR